MQSNLTFSNKLRELERSFIDEIEDIERRINPEHATTYNRSLQNKIELIKKILRVIELNPTLKTQELIYLINCKIEGTRIVLDNAKTIDITNRLCDELENME